MASKKAPAKKAPAKKSPARASAAKRPAAKKVVKKAAPKKAGIKKARPPAKKAKAAFGRTGTAGKADGDAPVRAYIAALPPAQREIVQRLDALIGETVPDVRRALKWSAPMYGREGKGWFASIGSFKNHVSLNFFRGTSLTPPPPLGESEQMRRVNIADMGEYDEKRFRSWIEQASAMQGWATVR